MSKTPLSFGPEFTNATGEVIGCYTTYTKPIYIGLSRNFEPVYTYELVSRPMLYAYPEVRIDIPSN